MYDDSAERAIELLFSRGEWFQFPRKLLKHLKPAQCILFSCLAGYARALGRDRGENDGWFYRTVQDVEHDIYMNRDSQLLALERITNLGMIEQRLAGVPPKRHFRICWNRIIQLLSEDEDEAVIDSRENPIIEKTRQTDDEKTRQTDDAKTRHKRDRVLDRKIEEEKFSPLPNGAGLCDAIDPRQEDAPRPYAAEGMKAAKKLVVACTQSGRTSKQKPNITAWAERMRCFYANMPEERFARIDVVLDWFCANVSNPWLPKIGSAKGFCETFNKIEATMERDKSIKDKRNGYDAPAKRAADAPTYYRGQMVMNPDDGSFNEYGIVNGIYLERKAKQQPGFKFCKLAPAHPEYKAIRSELVETIPWFKLLAEGQR